MLFVGLVLLKMKKILIKILKLPPFTPVYYFLRGFKLRRQDGLMPQDIVRFYAGIIKKGDLVFDVGANYGNRAKVFHKIGAKVIAFEP